MIRSNSRQAKRVFARPRGFLPAVFALAAAIMLCGCLENGTWSGRDRIRTFRPRRHASARDRSHATGTLGRADHDDVSTESEPRNIDPQAAKTDAEISNVLDKMVQAQAKFSRRDQTRFDEPEVTGQIDSSSLAYKVGQKTAGHCEHRAPKTTATAKDGTGKPYPWQVRPDPGPTDSTEDPAIDPPLPTAPKDKVQQRKVPRPRPKPAKKASKGNNVPEPSKVQITAIKPIGQEVQRSVTGSSDSTSAGQTAPYTANQATNVGAKPHRRGTNDQLAEMIARLKKKIDVRPDDLGAQVKLKLLYAILGRWKEALKADPGGELTGSTVAENLARLIKLFDQTTLAPADRADRALDLVKKLQADLKNRADLRIADFKLCRAVSSFSCYEVMEPSYFQPGRPRPVVVYIELDNFTSKYLQDKKQYQTILAVTAELIDTNGKLLLRNHYKRVEDLAGKKRRDFYIAPQLTLPSMPTGRYTVKVIVEDLLGNKMDQASITLDIVASK